MPDDVADTIIRKTISLPASTWAKVEDYQFANRVKRDAEAIRRLVDLGLQAAKDAANAITKNR